MHSQQLKHLALDFEDERLSLQNVHIPLRCCSALTSLRLWCAHLEWNKWQLAFAIPLEDMIAHLKSTLQTLAIRIPPVLDFSDRFTLKEHMSLKELILEPRGLSRWPRDDTYSRLLSTLPPQLEFAVFFAAYPWDSAQVCRFIESAVKSHTQLRRLFFAAGREGSPYEWTYKIRHRMCAVPPGVAEACAKTGVTWGIPKSRIPEFIDLDQYGSAHEGVAGVVKDLGRTRPRLRRERFGVGH